MKSRSCDVRCGAGSRESKAGGAVIIGYGIGEHGLERQRFQADHPPEPLPLWLDVQAPDETEREALRRLLGVRMPSPEEMREIEPTSRLYQDGDAIVMTALVPESVELEHAATVEVAFIHVHGRLITLRYADAAPIDLFVERLEQDATDCRDHDAVFLGLLDAVVDRVADGLEFVAAHIDELSADIFGNGRMRVRRDYRKVLKGIGEVADAISRARESLFTLDRLVSFFNIVASTHSGERRGRTRPLSRDIKSLADHADFLADKAGFLLDATLGMVGLEQNAIIKIFSVMAVVFLPPTLIASIYGMNFDFMPELDWPLGYPLAILLMIISAILPYRFFKFRGWL